MKYKNPEEDSKSSFKMKEMVGTIAAGRTEENYLQLCWSSKETLKKTEEM